LAFLGVTPDERQKASVGKKSQFLDMLAGHLIHDRYLVPPLGNIFSNEKNSAMVLHTCATPY
jgi:hypothetical protein